MQQIELFPDQLFLKSEDPVHQERRFLLMVVHRDLFGGASLIQESGYIGDAGQIKIDHHPDEGAAVDALALMAAKKRRQGYLEG
jgi:predicted DNA-binding WGR domain protein